MSRTIDRGESKVFVRSKFARRFAIYMPLLEPLTCEGLLPWPLHLQGPSLVSNPIRDPVVCTSIYEYFDAASEKLSDIELIIVEFVPTGQECLTDGIRTSREVSE